MRLIVALLACGIFSACETKPYVKHELEFTRIADDCSAMNTDFHMNSNLNGERYEIERCLDADFSKEQLTSVQRGTVVELKFERKNPKQALYKLVIDVDAYPRYDTLIIDGTAILIHPYEK
jgi:hypothetical protein